MSALKLISIIVCLILVAGYLNRARRLVHIPLMAGAFLIDSGIVLYIELSRGAIETAGAKMSPLMVLHICISLAVLVLYVGQVITGIKNARGGISRWHAKAAIWLLVARFGNLITSFLVT